MKPALWFQSLPDGTTWAALWSGYFICGSCRAIRGIQGNCPVCDHEPPDTAPGTVIDDRGQEIAVYPCFNGAEGRFEDWIYLQMIQYEWERPTPKPEGLIASLEAPRPSTRAALVLLFWGYFETRIERLMRMAFSGLPLGVQDDLLERYSSISSRLERLYKVAFKSTYGTDLAKLGYEDIARHLKDIQQKRNRFAHGDPRAIDDETVASIVRNLPREHEAWIAVYNLRATSFSREPET